MLAILIVGGAVVAGLTAAKTAATGVATAIPLGLKKRNTEYERAFSTGRNPVYEKDVDRRNLEMVQKGLPPLIPEEEYARIDLSPEDLPPEMHWLLKHNPWVLTDGGEDSEKLRFFGMMRQEMLTRRIGSYGVWIVELCRKHHISHAKLGSMTWGGLPVCYDKLIFFSENRKKDPIIRQKLGLDR